MFNVSYMGILGKQAPAGHFVLTINILVTISDKLFIILTTGFKGDIYNLAHKANWPPTDGHDFRWIKLVWLFFAEVHTVTIPDNYLEVSPVVQVTKNLKVSKGAKIRNRYNQVPHLTQDTNGKVTNSVRHHKREPRGQPFPSR